MALGLDSKISTSVTSLRYITNAFDGPARALASTTDGIKVLDTTSNRVGYRSFGSSKSLIQLV